MNNEFGRALKNIKERVKIRQVQKIDEVLSVCKQSKTKRKCKLSLFAAVKSRKCS